MLKALNFVRGAVATKDIIPVLTHYHVEDGRIQGSNGRVTIDHPCPELTGFSFTVPAAPFLKAVDFCEGEPKLKVLEGDGFLEVSRGKFKTKLPLAPHAEYPRQEPMGEGAIQRPQSLLGSLDVLQPFISEDASRLWACGVLFKDGFAYATNNIVIVRVPTFAFDIPLNLPAVTVTELLRIKQEPVSALATTENITFFFENGAWLKAQLLSTEWPAIERMFNVEATTPIPAGLQSAVEKVLPFCPDLKFPVIKFSPEGVSTQDGTFSAQVSGFTLTESAFRADPLLDVLRIATHMDIGQSPCPFKGGTASGIISGVKVQ